MKGKLASRKNEEFARIQAERLGREYRERIEGTRKYNTFDLEDTDKLGLEVLTEPLLRDVKKVVLWADEKRRTMEDYRAWRRNRNGWIGLAVSVCIGVVMPLVFPAVDVWLLNMCSLVPQVFLLAVRTVRKY